MDIKHDKLLDIATGTSRKTKTWKNKPVQWSDLLDRLSNTTRTPETVAEYKAMTRNRQAEVKDVGGFVGGYCNNGRRSDIRHRSILCLDADYADDGLWPDWLTAYGCAAAVYSTHKHTPEKPRLRLVIPLSRNVSPDEYQAIGRRVADTLGIDKFDDTSYQPQRMMYWPSTSQDGEYVFQYLDAPMLNPDTILATYHDWTDISSWPQSSRVAAVVKRSAAKQQDPLTKPGLVGAFCRAYPIRDAIDAFVPEYQPCDDPGRYTYTGGSTAAGVVVYDDKFTYSHHATDPASMQLCNSWDLVRQHKFHLLDLDTDPGTAPTKRPSYRAMMELATQDPHVRAQLVDDRIADANADFANPVDSPGDENWKSQLKITDKGGIAQTIDNATIILRNDPRLAGTLALDEMQHCIQAVRSLPWRDINSPSQWSDADDAALRYYLERTYGISCRDKIFDAVNVVASENAYHPIRDYLNSCTWDGVPRVETLLIDYLGADDTPYTRAVTRKALVAAVARIYRPGCKFDHMLTIRGRQGIGKSALIARLGGAWFSDTFSTLQGKEAYEQIMGVWIMEVGELAGLRRAETESIKLYISKQTDRFRPAYGRRMQEFPRQCIFIGTTNETQFLRDTTGNRRFWIVDTPNQPRLDMWEELTEERIKQIWAEAVALFRQGETLFLPRYLEQVAREVQETYEEDNPRAGLVADYLDKLLPDDWEEMDMYSRRQWLETDVRGTIRRDTVTVLEIWVEALGNSPDRLDRYAAKDLRDIMNAMPGWVSSNGKQRTFKLYGRQRYYKRIGGNDNE